MNLSPMAGLPGTSGGSGPDMDLGFALGARLPGWLAGAQILTLGRNTESGAAESAASDPVRPVTRSNAHAVLAGLQTEWFHVMFGTALVEQVATTATTFHRVRQGGIPVMHAAITLPFGISEAWTLKLGAGRLQTLGPGASPSTTTQRYLDGSQTARPGLALDDGASPQLENDPGSRGGAAESLLAPMNTLTVGLDLRL